MPLSRDPAAVGRADAVTFTSSSTVTNFLDAVGPAGIPPTVVTIGPVTSATATRNGLNVTAEAEPHTIDGLIEALVASLARADRDGGAGTDRSRPASS